jgi:predicted XRE-type DNA-binding protein
MTPREIAEDLQIAGLNPIPVLSTKAPLLPKGHPYLYEPFDNFPAFDDPRCTMVGVVGGPVSSNIACIDFDAHDGQPITDIFKQYGDNDTFRSLVKSNRISIETTPSGGYHVIFLAHTALPCQNLAYWERLPTEKNAKKMIEVKASGGYFICAPSPRYTHIRGADIFNLDPLSEEETNFLLNKAKSLNRDFEQNSKIKDAKNRKWPEQWPNDTPEGRYNNEYQDHVLDMLREVGWTVADNNNHRSTVYHLVRPGKNVRDGLSATYNHFPGMFYVFTDADANFEGQRAYTPFNVLTILKFNNDWKAAKQYCAELFNMDVIEYPVEPFPELPEADEFPIEVFPKAWQAFIMDTANTLNYSPDYMACGMMAAFSSCLGNNAKIRVKSAWITPPIFWFAIVGSRGVIKSHPLKTCIKPLEKINKEIFEDYRAAYAEYEKLDDKAKKGQKKPIYRQTMIQDATLEAICQVLSYGPRGLLFYKDELIGFINSMNQYRKGADEQFWLESFNNGSIVINRVTKEPVLIDNIFVNIAGTIQDSVLAELSKTHTENGFLDRFLFTKPSKKIARLTFDDLDPLGLQWWEQYIRDAFRDFGNNFDPYTVDLTTEARHRYLECDNQLCLIEEDENVEPFVKGYISKLKTYMPRFCLLFCAMDMYEHGTNLEVDPSHVDRAFSVIQYFFKTARKIFVEQHIQTEINEFINTLKGKSAQDKIIKLCEKYPDMKQKSVAEILKVSTVYVSKVLKKNGKKKAENAP